MSKNVYEDFDLLQLIALIFAFGVLISALFLSDNLEVYISATIGILLGFMALFAGCVMKALRQIEARLDSLDKPRPKTKTRV